MLIEVNGYLDFFIDCLLGMKGYIFNLIICGEGVINNNGEQFVCWSGDILLFLLGEIYYYGWYLDVSEWYYQWVYFWFCVYWQEWLIWLIIFVQIGFFCLDEVCQLYFSELFGQIISVG